MATKKAPAKTEDKKAAKTKVFPNTPEKKVKTKKSGITNTQLMKLMGESIASKASE